MKKEIRTRPIGVYDSGIGGLTVAHAISQLLPHEDIIYFGDTTHLPYGEKSKDALQSYSIAIINFLLDKKCKAIVTACHSASSACYTLLPKYMGGHTRIINAIDPMIKHLKKDYQGQRIGLIGTTQTILSEVYSKGLNNTSGDIRVLSLAAPLLAPMIEEGFFNKKIDGEVITQYLSNSSLANIDSLVLACTHYTLVKEQIGQFYKNRIPILDSLEVVATATASYLKKHELLNPTEGQPSREIFVSKCTSSFEACVQLLFGKQVQTQQHRINPM